MILQDFLRSNSIEDLTTKYAVKTNRHPLYNNLVLFKYDMIESPMAEAIVQECRGVILDESNAWAIVSRPFDKFFNHGEGHAKELDWNTTKVQEKVDGSLMTIYVYDNKWHVASSGTADAGGLVNDFGFSFAELFWKTFDQYDIVLPKKDCNMSFMFELCSQYNKIVVRHSTPSLTLLGARNLTTQQEMTPSDALKFFESWDPERRLDVRRTFDKLKAVREFPLTSFEEIFATFPSIDPLSMEGYIGVDAKFNRQKIKSPAYVALHHMRDSLGSQKALVTVALNGEIDEVGVAFPEYLDSLKDAKARIYDLVVELETAYDKIKHIPVQKDFALEATKTRCSSALFSVRGGKSSSIRSHIQNMNIDSVMNLLGYK
jgi:hypothetical protein